MMHALRFTTLIPLLLLAVYQSAAAKESSSPQAVIRTFYQAVADNQPQQAAALFSFALLHLDDSKQVEGFRADLADAFSEEFSTLARNYPGIELLNITPVSSLPEELAQYGGNCRAFHVDDSISQAQGGVEWALCEEKDGWKIMFSLTTE